MSFDRAALEVAIAAHGAVRRVVVATTAGSAPREAGASMLVWSGGQSGTIGGGALEFEAAAKARADLASGAADRVARLALGPALNQCCGGAVTLVSETWDAARLSALPEGPLVARPLPGGPEEMPLSVRGMLRRARGEGVVPAVRIVDGWIVEPATRPRRDVWLWGAGHVGRAIAGVLAPLPGLHLTWIDTARARFPGAVPEGVTLRVADDPSALVAEAPQDAEHLIVTFSHALDLALCHALLAHGFRAAGLIGSATKWARFRSRLAALGHAPDRIAAIRCPIGRPELGKHPQAIAIGVAAEMLEARGARGANGKERTG